MKSITFLELIQLELMKSKDVDMILQIISEYSKPVTPELLVECFQTTPEFCNKEWKQVNSDEYIHFITPNSNFIIEFRKKHSFIFDCRAIKGTCVYSDLYKYPKNLDQLITDLARFNFNMVFTKHMTSKIII